MLQIKKYKINQNFSVVLQCSFCRDVLLPYICHNFDTKVCNH